MRALNPSTLRHAKRCFFRIHRRLSTPCRIGSPFADYPGFQKNCVCLKPLYRGRVRKPIDPMQLCWLYCKEKTR